MFEGPETLSQRGRYLFGLGALLLGGCTPPTATTTPANGSVDPATPVAPVAEEQILELRSYREGLRVVELDIGGEPRTMLFDTGAGVTAISPEVASAVGCVPYGRLTGHRMSGERLDLPLCTDIRLSHGNVTLELESVAVLDLATMMPPDWPSLDGVVGLNAFEDRVVEVDLGCNRLAIRSVAHGSGVEARVRASRPSQGRALDMFVSVPAENGTYWFLIDSGNTGPVIVAEHATRGLGIEGSSAQVMLPFEGLEPRPANVVVADLILDGNLGTPFLEAWRLELDLGSARMWVAPSSCTSSASPDER